MRGAYESRFRIAPRPCTHPLRPNPPRSLGVRAGVRVPGGALGDDSAATRVTLPPMARDKQEPKQRLPKTGEEIPVPKRSEVFRDLRKGARVRSAPRRPKK